MALSYETLDNEAAWRAQVVPPALEGLGAGLRTHYGVGRDRIGSPGNNLHLRGGHRSRRWILESAFCTSRTYTVTYAADKLGDPDWYTAIDIDPDDRAELVAMTRRLDAACRAGLFPEISEWFGNLGGDSVVDGWNNVAKRPATSGSSHLSHTHITLLRKYANDAALMQRLLATLIGDGLMAMTTTDADAMKWRIEGITHGRTAVAGGPLKGELIELNVRALAQDAALSALAEKIGLDPAELDAVKAAAREGALAGAEAALTPEALADAIPDELAADVVRLLGDRQAAALRAAADVVDAPPA